MMAGSPLMTGLLAAGLVLLVAAGAVAGYAATRPDTFRIERSIRIAAPPEKIFALIGDFKNWVAWSPWEKKDPDMKRLYSGPPRGTGASYEWEGDRSIGHGRMEVTNAVSPSALDIDLEFFSPMEAHHKAEFRLTPEGEATHVTWAMYGTQTYAGKLISVFMSMEKMVGPDFEAGLSALKAVAEN